MSFNFKDSLLKSANEALEISKGELEPSKKHKFFIPENVDVKNIRLKLNISRGEFCEKYGFKLRTLEKWEQKITTPDSAARAYLTTISKSCKNRVIIVILTSICIYFIPR